MLCDIITDIVERQRDMYVVRVLETRDGLLAAAEASPADVVILGLFDSTLPHVCNELLAAHPKMKVLAVVGNGRRLFLHELQPQTVALGEVSPRGLIEAIRAAVRPALEAHL
jgi:DNA-binding NarL/FixJ family response regulator